MASSSGSIKTRAANTLKWNTIDRLASQLVFAAVGIVLANRLNREDFGLVGALAIFQAFATIFVDSGFGAALLRLKKVYREDYSTVFWFNLLVSIAIYFILWFATPSISRFFNAGERLVPLSKVMFLSFVVNGLGIVQTNRLMKKMRVKKIAIANIAGLSLGGGLGVGLALGGFGAWALVWQTLAQAAVRTGCLWVIAGWRPSFVISRKSFSKIWRVGTGVLSTSFLNTLFLNIYNFVIGRWFSLAALGVYTQADKWSKMGSASISQILTSTFIPLLAKVQDDDAGFRRYVCRMNRITAFLTFPSLAGMAVIAAPIFHFLFGNKWDDAIPLFQILAIRGIFIVLVSQLTNYLLALGYARTLVIVETVKDMMLVAAIVATIWGGSVSLLVQGQLWASVITYGIVLIVTSRRTGLHRRLLVKGFAPFLGATAGACLIAALAVWISSSWPAFLSLAFSATIGIATYALTLRLMRVPELNEAISEITNRL